MATELTYAAQMELATLTGRVRDVRAFDAVQYAILLDRTIFCPQGGGQACDIGVVQSPDFDFVVSGVRMADAEVMHLGHFARGLATPGMPGAMSIDLKRRLLNSRLQTGGHLLVNAMRHAGQSTRPIRGYHFPDNPHVDFEGGLSAPREQLRARLQRAVDELIAAAHPVAVEFMEHAEARDRGIAIPAGLPPTVPIRLVTIDGLPQACGGTHVPSLACLDGMRVLDVRARKGHVRVQYAVAGAPNLA